MPDTESSPTASVRVCVCVCVCAVVDWSAALVWQTIYRVWVVWSSAGCGCQFSFHSVGTMAHSCSPEYEMQIFTQDQKSEIHVPLISDGEIDS